MLPFENMVADYLKETNNHVLYRVTPIFQEDELVARGVTIEAYSVEDDGEGIQFYVYCYNVQPDIEIDYLTGDSHASDEQIQNSETDTEIKTFVLNKSFMLYHLENCSNVMKISAKNKTIRETSEAELQHDGYDPAKCCIGR